MNRFENGPRFEFDGKSDENKENPANRGIIDTIRSKVQEKVMESRLPTKESLGYESTVGVYGGKINYDKENRMVYDMRGFVSKIDQIGDAVLRTYDEHTIKDPVEVLRRHPKWFFRFLAPGTKRYRGSKEEIAGNIKRLGLEDEYGLHDWGIEIKNQEIYSSGTPLQDIYRSDVIGDESLKKIDRFKALEMSAKYIKEIHNNHGAVGEVLPSDIIFRTKEEDDVANPVLNIPDIVFNEEKQTSEVDKKTTDLLDFLVTVILEELRRSKDWNEAKKAVRTILDSYEDKKIISLAVSFVKRGRLTMLGDEDKIGLSKTATVLRPIVSAHNKARLGFDKDTTGNLRDLIVSECKDYLSF